MTLHPDKINPVILAMFMWQGFMGAEPWSGGPSDAFGGQCGAAVSLARFVPVLEEAINTFLATKPDTDFPGVLDYEVSEPFGAWVRGNRFPHLDQARAKAEELVEKFFAVRNRRTHWRG